MKAGRDSVFNSPEMINKVLDTFKDILLKFFILLMLVIITPFLMMIYFVSKLVKMMNILFRKSLLVLDLILIIFIIKNRNII